MILVDARGKTTSSGPERFSLGKELQDETIGLLRIARCEIPQHDSLRYANPESVNPRAGTAERECDTIPCQPPNATVYQVHPATTEF